MQKSHKRWVNNSMYTDPGIIHFRAADPRVESPQGMMYNYVLVIAGNNTCILGDHNCWGFCLVF